MSRDRGDTLYMSWTMCDVTDHQSACEDCHVMRRHNHVCLSPTSRDNHVTVRRNNPVLAPCHMLFVCDKTIQVYSASHDFSVVGT